jgi:hypothetical protein
MNHNMKTIYAMTDRYAASQLTLVHRVNWISSLLATVILAAPASSSCQELRLPIAEYRDKLKAGWACQMAGVAWGRPTEFRFNDQIIPEERVPTWEPGRINNGFGEDDIYVEMTFLRTLEQHGIDVPIRQAGLDFANSGYMLWCANAAGRTNLRWIREIDFEGFFSEQLRIVDDLVLRGHHACDLTTGEQRYGYDSKGPQCTDPVLRGELHGIGKPDWNATGEGLCPLATPPVVRFKGTAYTIDLFGRIRRVKDGVWLPAIAGGFKEPPRSAGFLCEDGETFFYPGFTRGRKWWRAVRLIPTGPNTIHGEVTWQKELGKKYGGGHELTGVAANGLVYSQGAPDVMVVRHRDGEVTGETSWTDGKLPELYRKQLGYDEWFSWTWISLVDQGRRPVVTHPNCAAHVLELTPQAAQGFRQPSADLKQVNPLDPGFEAVRENRNDSRLSTLTSPFFQGSRMYVRTFQSLCCIGDQAQAYHSPGNPVLPARSRPLIAGTADPATLVTALESEGVSERVGATHALGALGPTASLAVDAPGWWEGALGALLRVDPVAARPLVAPHSGDWGGREWHRMPAVAAMGRDDDRRP